MAHFSLYNILTSQLATDRLFGILLFELATCVCYLIKSALLYLNLFFYTVAFQLPDFQRTLLDIYEML